MKLYVLELHDKTGGNTQIVHGTTIFDTEEAELHLAAARLVQYAVLQGIQTFNIVIKPDYE